MLGKHVDWTGKYVTLVDAFGRHLTLPLARVEVSSTRFIKAGKFKNEIAVNENLAWECLLGNNFWKVNRGLNDFIQNLNSGDASLTFNRRTSSVRQTLVEGIDLNPDRAMEDNMAGSCIQFE